MSQDFLQQYGVKGQKWGVRKYQNEDGTLTAEGQARYGNVILGIGVVDESPEASQIPDEEVFQTALDGNPILKDVQGIIDPAQVKHVFFRFQPEVIQFYNDDQTDDYNGNWNGLAEDIAREIFINRRWDIQFCTASKKENA